MTLTNHPAHSDLPPAVHMQRLFARARMIALCCVLIMTGLGWTVLAMMESYDRSLLDQLCKPLEVSEVVSPRVFLLLFVMWGAMALAMMLPTAAPMLVTYAEIAETAAHKNIPVISPLILALGYVAVWMAFPSCAAALQTLVTLSGGITYAGLWVPAGLFLLAGAYQFSALKHACLRACQRPFSFFFRNWRTTTGGVFGLGVRQGLYCLGCCWAMMSLMFIAGAMNVVWMVALGLVMVGEKTIHYSQLSRAIGLTLLGVGTVFAISAVK